MDIKEACTMLSESGNDELLEVSNMIARMDKALAAATLLCKNLRAGGHGHMTLVEQYCDRLEEIEA
jgi:hypothetical protein